MREGEAVGHALRRAVGTRARVVLAGLTLIVGLVSAFGLAFGLPPDQRTLAITASVVQSLMSVLVPFTTVLVAADLGAGRAVDTARAARSPDAGDVAAGSLVATWCAAAVYALVVGVFGSLVSLLATLAGSGSLDRAPTLLVAGPIVQLIAAGVGTAFGLLIRPPWIAMIATIVIPLGVWALLGRVGLDAARGWLTPFAAVQRVFGAPLTPLAWIQWLVVALIWTVGLNAVAALSGGGLSGGGQNVSAVEPD
jgi:hypothetical protein